MTCSLIVAERARNVRTLISRELTRAGYSVVTLGSGQELCRELEADSAFRVVLLDPDLPGLTEPTVLEKIQSARDRICLFVHSYGAEQFVPLAEMTRATVDRTGDMEFLRRVIGPAIEECSPVI